MDEGFLWSAAEHFVFLLPCNIPVRMNLPSALFFGCTEVHTSLHQQKSDVINYLRLHMDLHHNYNSDQQWDTCASLDPDPDPDLCQFKASESEIGLLSRKIFTQKEFALVF